MNRVVKVKALANFQLAVWFENGKLGVFDTKPYLDKGVFSQLKDPVLFQQAYVAWDTVCWPNNLDIAPDTLYAKCEFDVSAEKVG